MNKFGFLLISALVATAPAQAATVFYDFNANSSATDGGGVQISNADAYGNVRQYVDSGVTMTATAWGVTGSGSTTFQAARLFQWATFGYGVCTQLDGADDCGLPSHSIDNEVSPTSGTGAANPTTFNGTGFRYEFLLFQFSAPVSITSMVIDPYDNPGQNDPNDRDVTYYTSTNALSGSVAGVSLAGLAGLGFGAQVNQDSTPSYNELILNSFGSGPVRALLIGARVAGDPAPDYFKIEGLTIDTAPVTATPEPGTLGMLGAALFALGLARRRTVK